MFVYYDFFIWIRTDSYYIYSIYCEQLRIEAVSHVQQQQSGSGGGLEPTPYRLFVKYHLVTGSTRILHVWLHSLYEQWSFITQVSSTHKST